MKFQKIFKLNSLIALSSIELHSNILLLGRG